MIIEKQKSLQKAEVQGSPISLNCALFLAVLRLALCTFTQHGGQAYGIGEYPRNTGPCACQACTQGGFGELGRTLPPGHKGPLKPQPTEFFFFCVLSGEACPRDPQKSLGLTQARLGPPENNKNPSFGIPVYGHACWPQNVPTEADSRTVYLIYRVTPWQAIANLTILRSAFLSIFALSWTIFFSYWNRACVSSSPVDLPVAPMEPAIALGRDYKHPDSRRAKIKPRKVPNEKKKLCLPSDYQGVPLTSKPFDSPGRRRPAPS